MKTGGSEVNTGLHVDQLPKQLGVLQGGTTQKLESLAGRLGTGRIPRAIRNFPVTIQIALPYSVLVLPQAVIFDNPDTSFIVGVMSLGLLGSFAIEVLARARSGSANLVKSEKLLASYGRSLKITAIVAILVGQLTSLAAASLGAGTVASQVGITSSRSSLTPLLTLFSTWTASGCALLVASYLAGQVRKNHLHAWFLLAVAMECGRAVMTTITASVLSLSAYLLVLLLLVGAVRLRVCVIAILLALVVWPTIFQIRNEIRRDSGIQVSSTVDAFDRLRYDEQIARAEALPAGIDVGQIGPEGVLRYGLIPRFIDSDRPPLSTGNLINVYVGGVATSSLTFLPVTTLYVLEGPAAVIAFYALLALIVFITLRNCTRLSPTRLVVFGLIAYGPLDWLAGYPDATVGALQGIVASLPLLLFVSLGRVRPTPAGRAPKATLGKVDE